LSAYLTAFIAGADAIKAKDIITKPAVFKGVLLLFPQVAQRVKDRYGKTYTTSSFSEILTPMFARLKTSTFKNTGAGHRDLYEQLAHALRTSFTL
jgi:hypothetical protein